jgi:hypothetical protein
MLIDEREIVNLRKNKKRENISFLVLKIKKIKLFLANEKATKTHWHLFLNKYPSLFL